MRIEFRGSLPLNYEMYNFPLSQSKKEIVERKTEIGPLGRYFWDYVKGTLENSEINRVRTRSFVILEFAKSSENGGYFKSALDAVKCHVAPAIYPKNF